jgi:hypothetical protein
VSTGVAGRTASRPLVAARSAGDRLVAVLPLASIFLWLCVLYAWEAWRHGTPWLFTDELQLAELSRSIAHHGRPELRGDPSGLHSLYVVLTAPAWLLPGVAKGYAAAKYIGVVAMTLTLVPAYLLARLVASPLASLVAGLGATAAPFLVYSSYLTPEAIAYPWATLCLYLIAQALITKRRWWIVAAVLASLVAPAVKGALAVVPAAFAVAALLMLWSSERGRRWRARWTPEDWTGWLFLVAGAVIVAGGFLSMASQQYLLMTWYYHGRIFWHAMWATGALTIGLGVAPLVTGIGVLLRLPGEQPSRAFRAFRCTFVAAALAFGLYTGIKGAYNQYEFATRVWERNIMYVAPLLFVGLAVWLDRRRLNPWAAGFGIVFAAFLLGKTPYLMQFRFSSDSPGLAILGELNRRLSFTPTDAKILLYAILVVTALLLLAPQLVRRISLRAATGIAAALAVFVVGWNIAGQLSASAATTAFSDQFLENIHRPMDWVDAHTHGARTVYLGQSMDMEQESTWLLEFWNRSLTDMWSLDGTAPGPGATMTPDVRGDNGVLLDSEHRPVTRDVYAIVDPGIDVAGTFVARHPHSAGGGIQDWRLIKVAEPIRLLGSVTGLYPDHWSQPSGSAYTRYGGAAGTLRLHVSRLEALGKPSPATVTITMGTLGIDKHRQPTISHVTKVVRWTITGHAARWFTLKPPSSKFRVEVTVTPPFVPAATPGADSSDRRQLGAVLTYRFVPSAKAAQR